MVRLLILFLFVMSFVSAVDVDFDCPDEVEIDEEFFCSLEVSDGEGIYDVKVEIKNGRDDVAEIWNEDKDDWQSAYYYLQDFIGDDGEKTIDLKIVEDGDYDGVLKLRDEGGDREFFDFEIRAEKGEEVYVEDEKEDEIVLSPEPLKAISLNGDGDSELVYESKDSKIMNWLPYAFSVFLIIVIGILFWERF